MHALSPVRAPSRAVATLAGLALAVLVTMAVPSAVRAEAAVDGDSPDAPGTAYCGAVARHCGETCVETTEPGSADAASCQARCAVERSACEARDSLSQVKPWLDDQADKMDSFVEGFQGNGGDRYVEEPNLHHDDEENDPAAPQATPVPPSDPGSDSAAVATCETEHDACVDRCERRHPGDDYAQAGCTSVCALDRATCEANAGVESAKPFIKREADRLRDFFDGLLEEDAPAPPPSRPAPPPASPPALGTENPDGTMDL